MGLSGAKQPPGSVSQWLQVMVAKAELAAEVPDTDGLRRSFERLRILHAYGILRYDMFTVAEDMARFVLEQALRVRFVSFYEGHVPVADVDGHEATFLADGFDDVYSVFSNRGSLGRSWRLRLQSGKPWRRSVPTGLKSLLDWARSEGLLDGTRSRVVETALLQLRHLVAHPDSYHLVGPTDSALAIRDLAEIINRLWGVRTPDGRLHPAPIAREVRIIGWLGVAEGFKSVYMRPEQLAYESDEPWTYIVVRAVPQDGGLRWFQTRHEMTYFPVDLLWGPGDRDSLSLWLERERPTGDEVSYIDRLFVVQVDGGNVMKPRSPSVVLALPEDERAGQWHLLRADDPFAPLAHVRRKVGTVPGDPAGELPVDELVVGSWDEIAEHLREQGFTDRGLPTDVRVPW